MALDEPSDVSGLAIATDGSSLPVRFKAEYRVMDAEGNPTDEFKTLVDYSSSTSMKANVMARLSKSVFTDQVRVTFLNEGELGVSDIMLYKADVTSSLVSRDQLRPRLPRGPYLRRVCRQLLRVRARRSSRRP